MINHEGAYKAYPQIKVMLGDVAWDAEGNVVIYDVSLVNAATAQLKVNKEALAYLASTDWMVLRQADSGEVMPNNIKELRAAARLEIKP